MPLVAAKCTQCGANIEVDDSKEAGICKFCGTAFITEKAVTNYIANNTYNIQNANFVMPEKNIDNLKKLANDEYKNKKYESADNYFKQILEICANDYECEYMRYLISVREKSDYWPNAFIEKLSICITKLCGDPQINFEDKKKKVQDIFICSERVIMDIYCIERDSCLFNGKIIVQNGQSKGLHLNSSCNIAYQTLFRVLDEMAKFLDSEYDIKHIWNEICMDIQIILDMRTSARFGTDGIKYYTTPSGAEEMYKVAKQLKEYATKTNSNFKLHESLIPQNEGGKGIELAKGCYIATSIYGSYDCPQVWTLRRFRDYTLNITWYGRLFIKCYYAISPTLVKWFGKTKWFRGFWKSKLDRMVANLNSKGIDDVYYQDKY